MIPPKKNMNPIHVRYYTANSRKKKEEKTESPLFIVIINERSNHPIRLPHSSRSG